MVSVTMKWRQNARFVLTIFFSFIFLFSLASAASYVKIGDNNWSGLFNYSCPDWTAITGVEYHDKGGSGDNYINGIFCSPYSLELGSESVLLLNRDITSGNYNYSCSDSGIIPSLTFHDKGGSGDNYINSVNCFSTNMNVENTRFIQVENNQGSGLFNFSCNDNEFVTGVEFHDKGGLGDNYVSGIFCSQLTEEEDEVLCNSNSDCPSSSESSPFCSENDVSKNVTSYSCINPGTSQSQCVPSTQEVVVDSCDYSCLNAQCTIPSQEYICPAGTAGFGATFHDKGNSGDNYVDQLLCAPIPVLLDGHSILSLDNDVGEGLFNYSCPVNSVVTSASFTGDKGSGDDFINSLNCTVTNKNFGNTSFVLLDRDVGEGLFDYSCSLNSWITGVQFHDKGNSGDNYINGIFCSQILSTGNETIQCNVDSDCGSTITSELMCMQNNSVYDITSFTCNNPGTTNSFCSSSTVTNTFQQCENGCSNGQCQNQTNQSICGNNILEQGEQCDDGNTISNDGCSNACTTETITCHSNSDCDDHDSSTRDLCFNPGQYDSYCSNNPRTISGSGSSDYLNSTRFGLYSELNKNANYNLNLTQGTIQLNYNSPDPEPDYATPSKLPLILLILFLSLILLTIIIILVAIFH